MDSLGAPASPEIIHKAVVTGANGYLAGEIVHQLLQKGYEVHGTVRDPANKAKTAHLVALGAAFPGRLHLHAADLLQAGSFDEVVMGATFVFHTASPVLVRSEHPQEEVIDPAVAGTKNVLSAALRARSATKISSGGDGAANPAAASGPRRVVLTSSLVAVHSLLSATPPLEGSCYTEEDWNNDSTIENNEWYPLSKVLAERAAWEFAEKERLDLVVINPSFILGPALSASATAAVVQTFAALLSNRESMFSAPNLQFPSCDVRDVARAHILAAETPSASGRYIVSQPHVMRTADIVAALRDRFPGIQLPDGADVPLVANVDSSKVTRELGLVLMSERESVVDMAVSLVQLNAAAPVFNA